MLLLTILALLKVSSAAQTLFQDSFEARCAALADGIAISNENKIHINFAHYVPAGTTLDLIADGYNKTCGGTTQKVSSDVCRLAMKVETSDSSSIIMEQWLPRNWSGRFLSTGNGGLSGCSSHLFSSFLFHC